MVKKEEDFDDFEEDFNEEEIDLSFKDLIKTDITEPPIEEPPQQDYNISECLIVNNVSSEYIICGNDRIDFLDGVKRANDVLQNIHWYRNKKKWKRRYKDAMVFISDLQKEYRKKAVNIDRQIISEIRRDPVTTRSYHTMNLGGIINTPGHWSTETCEDESEWYPEYDAGNIERDVPDYFNDKT